ncbi:MAG: Phosphate acyltransferase [Alphaproteobacteria bacterium MarineAlpha5_Bin7]|nr:MAG: Phosphate acyltransferase [Alphaproteobacteria bacterium MarineAlpha5_Bin7]|tara:strand:- start:9775 stop:10788 length:1014 start_codon:yes stop_codon:yes gene_type:complete
MDQKKITIAIDAMGGDDAPYKCLKGIEIFISNRKNIEIIILGDENIINDTLVKSKINLNNYKIINCINNIQNDDTANIILRNRKDSSINKGLEIVKNINNSGFVSSGNTAAIMILSRLNLGMIEGIHRPAICSLIPNKKNYSLMLDLGANVSSDPQNLFQFALMGYCYHTIFKPDLEPKIGIINIGTENNKGKEFLQKSADLIKESFLNKYFYGFLEPDKLTSGECDIMVSDGYTGNIILKTAEGMSKYITGNLKHVFVKSFLNKIAYSILKKDLKIFRDKINPANYDGAILLGVNGISIKSHGRSTPYAFSCAIERCYEFIKNDINYRIKNEINNN